MAHLLKGPGNDPWDIDFDNIQVIEKIGGGNYGNVYKGYYFGTPIAIKQILDVDDEFMHKYIEREMAILKDVRHPQIVQFMGLSKTEDGDVFIITEFIPFGDLRSKIKQRNKEIPWNRRIQIASETASAFAYLRSKNILHRDLKSSNLLVTENWKIKVCDFGFGRMVEVDSLMTTCGTNQWMAPEVSLGEKYNHKADVFSYGMVLVELLTRKKPPKRIPGNAFKFDIKLIAQHIPQQTPRGFIELIDICSKWDPKERPDFIEIICHLEEIEQTYEEDEKKKQNDDNKKQKKEEKEIEKQRESDSERESGSENESDNEDDKKNKNETEKRVHINEKKEQDQDQVEPVELVHKEVIKESERVEFDKKVIKESTPEVMKFVQKPETKPERGSLMLGYKESTALSSELSYMSFADIQEDDDDHHERSKSLRERSKGSEIRFHEKYLQSESKARRHTQTELPHPHKHFHVQASHPHTNSQIHPPIKTSSIPSIPQSTNSISPPRQQNKKPFISLNLSSLSSSRFINSALSPRQVHTQNPTSPRSVLSRSVISSQRGAESTRQRVGSIRGISESQKVTPSILENVFISHIQTTNSPSPSLSPTKNVKRPGRSQTVWGSTPNLVPTGHSLPVTPTSPDLSEFSKLPILQIGKDYVAKDQEEVTVRKGESVSLLNIDDTGWIQIQTEEINTGWIPSESVEESSLPVLRQFINMQSNIPTSYSLFFTSSPSMYQISPVSRKKSNKSSDFLKSIFSKNRKNVENNFEFDFSESEIDELILGLMDIESGVPIGKKRIRFTAHENVFLGSHAIAWMIHNKVSASKSETITLMQYLMDLGIFVGIDKNPQFREKSIYRFQFFNEQTDSGVKVLNVDKMWRTPIPKKRKNSLPSCKNDILLDLEEQENNNITKNHLPQNTSQTSYAYDLCLKLLNMALELLRKFLKESPQISSSKSLLNKNSSGSSSPKNNLSTSTDQNQFSSDQLNIPTSHSAPSLKETINSSAYSSQQSKNRKSFRQINHLTENLFDSNKIRQNEEFRIFSLLTCELQAVNLNEFHSEIEKIVFFVNLYNLLMIHYHLKYGPPQTLLAKKTMMERVFYLVNANHYSMDMIDRDILHGEINCRLDLHDLRRDHIIHLSNQFIVFSLSDGTMSTPCFRSFTCENFYQQIQSTTKEFLNLTVEYSYSNHTLFLPKIAKRLITDYGETEETVLEKILPMLDRSVQSSILTLAPSLASSLSTIPSPPSSPKSQPTKITSNHCSPASAFPSFRFLPYSWIPNYLPPRVSFLV